MSEKSLESGQSSKKSLAGRSPLLTPALITIVVLSIEEGLSYKDAANIASVNERTFYYWLARGRKLDTNNVEQMSEYEQLCLQFFHGVQKAVPQQKQNLIQKIMKAADRNWQAAAWMLERKYPDEFGRRARVDFYNWRVDVVELIKQGLQFDELAREIGDADATELFESAGMGIIATGARPQPDKTG